MRCKIRLQLADFAVRVEPVAFGGYRHVSCCYSSLGGL